MPIKQLFLKSRENQKLYEDIYPPLLRLITKNYPHLCLVEDCMFEESIKEDAVSKVTRFDTSQAKKKICSPEDLKIGKMCHVENQSRLYVK